MLFLEPIYQNTIGATYLIKDHLDAHFSLNRIQLVLGDIALILENDELNSFLDVIISAKKGCSCTNCKCSDTPKQITCNTSFTKFIFKSNVKNIKALEDLIEVTIFELQMHSILSFNEID